MINLFLEGISRSVLAVSFYLLLQHFGINRGDPIKAIGITTIFTHIMIGLMQPNLSWASDLFEKNK